MANAFWIAASGILLIMMVGALACLPHLYSVEAERMGRK